jgi:O-acetyl-ADP-ribose deacetylase
MLRSLGSCSFDIDDGRVAVQVDGLGGSVLDFKGDAFVNAANTGGVTGFGLDEMVNRACGAAEIKAVRKTFNGIPTGSAKSTSSFAHTNVRFVIHATGPVFRDNRMDKDTSIDDLYVLLQQTYEAALTEATRLGCKDLAFCLLSAGVFRGEEPADDRGRSTAHFNRRFHT